MPREDGTLDPQVVCSALITPEARCAVLQAIATSVELANRAAPDRWGLRLGPDSLMLKVGSHEVLQVTPSDLPFHIIVDRASVPATVRENSEVCFSEKRDYHGEPSDGYYSTNPGSEACDMPFELVDHLYPQLIAAHEAVIRRAAERFNPATRRAHSPELVAFVAAETGRSLNQPAYASTTETVSQAHLDLHRGGGLGSAERNALVEAAAVKAVTAHYQAGGWSVCSVEADKCGYDLHCTRGAEELHIEVKGTSGIDTRFIMTAKELRTATDDAAFGLCLVTAALSVEPVCREWLAADLLAAFHFVPISYFAVPRSAAGAPNPALSLGRPASPSAGEARRVRRRS